MTGEIKGYLLDYGGTLDTAGCHWGKFIWHGYERCRVGVAWDDFREAYVHTERALGQVGIILPDHDLSRDACHEDRDADRSSAGARGPVLG